MPVIMNPVDLLNQASDYTTELTWPEPSSTIKEATFFYLKTPTSILESNKAEDWGPALGDGTINTEGLSWVDSRVWGSGTYVENATNVTNSNVKSWPSTHGEYDSEKDGYVLSKNSTHWKTIFNAYKDTIKTQLSMENLQESDVDAIILTPFKVSRYNITTGKTEKSYHVDCKVEVKCRTFATATFKLWDDETNEYKYHSAENYQVDSSVTFPKVPDKPGYAFSGWYLDEGRTQPVGDTYTIRENVSFYGKYLIDKIGGGEDKNKPDGIPDKYQVTVNYVSADTSKGTVGTPTKEVLTIYKAGSTTEWAETGTVEASGSTAKAKSKCKFVNWTKDNTEVSKDATLGRKTINATGGNTYIFTANFEVQPEPETYTVIFNANGGSWADAATQKTQTYTEESVQVTSPASPEWNGYSFKGWVYRNDDDEDSNITPALLMGVHVGRLMDLTGATNNTITLYAKWEEAPKAQLTYTINKHYIRSETDEDNIEITGLSNKKGTEISKLIEGEAKNQDWRGNHYFYDSEKTTVNGTTLANNAKLENRGTVIDLYYYLDEVGETSEKNPNGGPDNIPDAWQYKVTFKVSNGKWDDQTIADVVAYVTNRKNGTPCAKGTEGSKATLNGVAIPGAGSQPDSGYRASGSWNTTLSTGLEIKGDTVFTYTYDQKSGGSGGSGGSSRPSTPPTVDIPDDVPTGLNGKDHYAYIIGYGNNDVRPQNNITRAEVATIFFRLLTDETREANMTKSNGYNDVKNGDWFCCAVSTLSKMGIIKGYEDGSFKPNDPISRAEFAAIAARFDPNGDKTPASFSDVTSHWAKDEISIAANHGWIKGYEDGSFKPDQKITRAETMTLVNRVLNRLPEAKDDLHKDMKTWIDNMDETAWYYLAVQEATNSHYFKNKTGTKFEQWTDLRDTRDWSELEK